MGFYCCVVAAWLSWAVALCLFTLLLQLLLLMLLPLEGGRGTYAYKI
jgi:hypothetical protein